MKEHHGNNASTVNTIRDNVAIWYVSLRNLAAIVLALILIYVAIRMAISTLAEEKAKYKNMLIDWLTSLCLLFVLHYIMVIVINLNNSFVELLKGVAEQAGDGPDLKNIGAQLVGDAFSTISFTQGVGYAVAYMMLVGMSFIYFFAYVKRMITLAFLIIIAPLITITYSIDKMGDGKSQALNTWLKEFTYNILIQPFQCIIYLSLVSTVLGMIDKGNPGLLTIFLSVYVLMFMYQAEEIVKNIFGFKSQSMGKTVAMAAITGAVIGKGTSLLKGEKDEKKKPTAGSDYKQRPRTKNSPDPVSGSTGLTSNSQTSGQMPSVGGGANPQTSGQTPSVGGGANPQTSGQMPSVGGGNQSQAAQTQNATTNTIPSNQARGTGGGLNMGYTPEDGPIKKMLIKGVKKAGTGLLKANVNTGLRIAGLALGLSTGDSNTGIAGWGLGSAGVDKIKKASEKHTIKTDEDSRHCSIANSIDDFQGNMTNTQVMQRVNDWMDGVSMPDQNDEAGLKLYQKLMEEQEIQKDQGKSSDETREIIDQLIKDSLSGAQSRVPKTSLAERVRNKFANQSANANQNTSQSANTTRGGNP